VLHEIEKFSEMGFCIVGTNSLFGGDRCGGHGLIKLTGLKSGRLDLEFKLATRLPEKGPQMAVSR
jgi:hypothetical protein